MYVYARLGIFDLIYCIDKQSLSLIEHRNMPLGSALKLAKETYIQYASFIRDRSNRSSTNVATLQSSALNSDRKIKQLFAFVSDNRDITLNEIHIMRTYLNTLENKLLAKRISSIGNRVLVSTELLIDTFFLYRYLIKLVNYVSQSFHTSMFEKSVISSINIF